MPYIEKIKQGKEGIVKKLIKKVLKMEQLSNDDKQILKELTDVDFEIYNEIYGVEE